MKFILAFLSLALVYSAGATGNQLFHSLSAVPPDLPVSDRESRSAARTDYLETITLPAPQITALAKNEIELALPGSQPLFADRMPEVPTLLKRIPKPAGATAVVSLENIQVEESTGVLQLHQAPAALVWAPQHTLDFAADTARYFPGKFFQAVDGPGYVSVTLFPVQYDRRTGKVVVLRSAQLDVGFERSHYADRAGGNSAGSEALIITSERLMPAAQLLRDFQGSQLQVRSEVVTVEAIDRSEQPVAETELPDGYKDVDGRDRAVEPFNAVTRTGYRYELAKKLIQFLQKRMGDGDGTRYVTLLGGAEDIPPSYYFSIGGPFSRRLSATDQCYAARRQCLEPRLALGRLPLTSVGEMKTYLGKAAQWLAYSSNAPSELSLYGGKAFNTDVYIGELGTLRLANSEEVDWRRLEKHFRTRRSYDKPAIMDLVRGKNPSVLVYSLDHGNGNQWYVEHDFVSAQEVMDAAPEPGGNAPVIVSIACTNAAFDEDLAKESLFAGGQYGKFSVGVSLLKSRAGAVAYVGSLRPAIGTPIYRFDAAGNLLVTGSSYGLQLMDTLFEKYRSARSGRLGDFVLKTLQAYVGENGNDMSTDKNRYSYFILELLGDPVLRLPERRQTERAYPMATSKTHFDGHSQGNFPSFLSSAGILNLVFQASTTVAGTLFKVEGAYSGGSEEVLMERSFSAGDTEFALPGDVGRGEGQYFLRLENKEGVPIERQVWFGVSKETH